MTFIVVRARSNVGVERTIKDTMLHLNLTKVNHAVIIPDNAQYRGMLQKAKDYITWGEATEELVIKKLCTFAAIYKTLYKTKWQQTEHSQ